MEHQTKHWINRADINIITAYKKKSSRALFKRSLRETKGPAAHNFAGKELKNPQEKRWMEASSKPGVPNLGPANVTSRVNKALQTFRYLVK